MTPAKAAEIRDLVARARIAAEDGRRDAVRVAVQEERRHKQALAAAETDLTDTLLELASGGTHRITERMCEDTGRWAREHAPAPAGLLPRGGGRASLGSAAALSPTCEVEARIASAIADAPCADYFDLAEHIRLIGAVVRRCRR